MKPLIIEIAVWTIFQFWKLNFSTSAQNSSSLNCQVSDFTVSPRNIESSELITL